MKKIMAVNDKMKDEKMEYDIEKKNAQIYALSSGKIDKC